MGSSKWKIFLPLLPTLLFIPILFSHHWITQHDTLGSVLWLQYFLGQLQEGWNAPLWNPYTAWGHTTHLPWLTSLSPSLCFLALFAKVIPGLNANTVFYLSCVMDEIILGIGVFALAKQTFSERTVSLFVTFTVVGTVCWSSQVYWNFRSYYLLPLAFSFFQAGVRGGDGKRLVAGAAVILTGSILGNVVYILFLHVLLALVFVAALLWAEKIKVSGASFLKWFRDIPQGLSVAGLLFLLGLTVAFIRRIGVPTLLAVERSADGVVSYRNFLNHVVYSDLRYFQGIFDGIQNHFDVTVYGGLLLLPLALYGVTFHWSRRLVPYLSLAVFLFLFWAGEKSFVAPLAYALPGADRYRYVGLVTPILKLALIFLAGFGLEKLLSFLEGDWVKRRYLAWLAFVVLFLSAFGVFVWRCQRFYSAEPRTVLIALLYLGYAIWLGAIVWHREVLPRVGRPLLLILVLIDVLTYRISLYNQKMFSVSETTWNHFQAEPLVFLPNRTENIASSEVLQQLVADTKESFGAHHNIFDTFFKIDRCFSPWVMDSAQPGVASLMRQYQIQPQTVVDFSSPELSSLVAEIGCETSKISLWKVSSSAVPVKSEFRVEAFQGTNLKIALTHPLSEPLVFRYADAWHPFWKAFVNGQEISVEKQGAFKSVRLPAGADTIEFYFFDWIANLLFYAMWLWGSLAGFVLFFGSFLFLMREMRVPFYRFRQLRLRTSQ